MDDDLNELQKRFEANDFFKMFGFHIKKMEEGEVILELPIREQLLNISNNLHGGVHATMLDTVLGLTVRTVTRERIPVTIDLDVRFFLPVQEGTVVAKGRIVHQGYKIVTSEGEITQGDKVIAKAIGSFKVK